MKQTTTAPDTQAAKAAIVQLLDQLDSYHLKVVLGFVRRITEHAN